MTAMQLLAQTTTDSNDLFGGFKDFFDSDVWLVVRNVFFFFLVVFWLASAFWVYKDARRRIEDPWLLAMLTGLPKTIVITSEEVRRALDEPVGQILDAIKSTLDKTPPELAADIMDRGIVLAGGGSLLTGLEERLREETQMPVQLAESPLTCVAVGSGRSLEEFEVIHRAAKARNRNGRRR